LLTKRFVIVEFYSIAPYRLGMQRDFGCVYFDGFILKGTNMNQTQAKSPSRLLSVESVAELLDVSKRHVYRLSDAGRMPRPIKLGGAVRWDAAAIADWIAAGCPQTQGARK
jgi:excisionase family DNA binding protein